jgi:hypothetical protein
LVLSFGNKEVYVYKYIKIVSLHSALLKARLLIRILDEPIFGATGINTAQALMDRFYSDESTRKRTLHPLQAVGYFFFSQSLSISTLDYGNNDLYVILLYSRFNETNCQLSCFKDSKTRPYRNLINTNKSRSKRSHKGYTLVFTILNHLSDIFISLKTFYLIKKNPLLKTSLCTALAMHPFTPLEIEKEMT